MMYNSYVAQFSCAVKCALLKYKHYLENRRIACAAFHSDMLYNLHNYHKIACIQISALIQTNWEP